MRNQFNIASEILSKFHELTHLPPSRISTWTNEK